jgi:3-phosphoshikimate 1-carboxyvinyltransferase
MSGSRHTVRSIRRIQGEYTVPGDKSIAHRSLMLASLAEGESEVSGFSSAGDPNSTLRCMQQLGIIVEERNAKLYVQGKGLSGFSTSTQSLDCGNSGTTMRLMSGILAGQSFDSTLTGDDSLCRRPMRRIVEPLTKMGAKILTTEKGTAPIRISGRHPLKAIEYRLPVASAQVKSAIILAALNAEGESRVIESVQTRDHTERMLGLNVSTNDKGEHVIAIQGGTRLDPRQFEIPGDPSSAAFLIVAGLITEGSAFVVQNVGLNPTRIHYIELLKRACASIEFINVRKRLGEDVGDIAVSSSALVGEINISGADTAQVIDEIPILSIAAALSGCSFSVVNAQELRAKESDRISALVSNLRLLGLIVDEYPDGFAFEGKKDLISNCFKSYNDHRIAMAFAVAGLALAGDTIIEDSDCVSISFPGFWETLNRFASR